MANYEVWITNDAGQRLTLLTHDIENFFFSYSRSVAAMGTLNIGMSFRAFESAVKPYFVPDMRVEMWRSPAPGIPLRREDVFMLRQVNVYTREDNVDVIQFYGNNGVDLLKRRCIIQRAGTAFAKKSDEIDDMMKAFVRQQLLYGSALDEDGVSDNSRALPQNEFFVQADLTLGTSITRDFSGRNLYETLKELRKTSFQLNESNSINRKIYFDVVPKDLQGQATSSAAVTGWEFQTFADLRGVDRTSGIEFSPENENIKSPSYGLDYLDEQNSIFIFGNGNGASQIIANVEDTKRVNASRWNRSEGVISASSETSTAALQDAGRVELRDTRPFEELLVNFLSTPGGISTPRSLYGIDWDLGDLVRVDYAKKQFNTEIKAIYVSVDENAQENITGLNEVRNA